MADARPPGMALVVSCNWHPRRPDHSCWRCRDAIVVNRTNPGWGEQYLRLSDGELVRYERYEPELTWSGPDAFCEPAVTSRGELILVPGGAADAW